MKVKQQETEERRLNNNSFNTWLRLSRTIGSPKAIIETKIIFFTSMRDALKDIYYYI